MFDDILKKNYDIDVIKRDIEIYLGVLLYEIMDTWTLNKILIDVNAYLKGYYGLETSGVSYDFDKKTVIITIDKETLHFPVEN